MPANLLDVGRIVRPHGIRGQVVVELWTNRIERMAAGTKLRGGDRELHVISAQPLPDRHADGRWLVSFEGATDRADAEALRGTVLQAPPMEVDDALWVHELIGSEVLDADGIHVGVVEAVQANPASDLLVLEDGRLIPLRFVVDRRPGRLTVSTPPGLLDL